MTKDYSEMEEQENTQYQAPPFIVSSEMGREIERIQSRTERVDKGTNIQQVMELTPTELECEYNLIKNKTSTLSSTQRQLVVYKYEFDQSSEDINQV